MNRTLIECTFARHGRAVADIINAEIATSTSVYFDEPRTAQDIEQWFAVRTARGYPVIAVEDDLGELLGFGALGVFRDWPAYRLTVEHSLYVAVPARRQGVGELLLAELVQLATRRGDHAMIGAVDGANGASIRLHRKLGFSEVGHLPEVGTRFGRWLDVLLFQRLLGAGDAAPAAVTQGAKQ